MSIIKEIPIPDFRSHMEHLIEKRLQYKYDLEVAMERGDKAKIEKLTQEIKDIDKDFKYLKHGRI